MAFKAMVLEQRQQVPRKAGVLAVAQWSAPGDGGQDEKSLDDVHEPVARFRLSAGFFLLAVISALGGMVWGIQMSASGDHSLSPAHGHLNLIGWVSLACSYEGPFKRF